MKSCVPSSKIDLHLIIKQPVLQVGIGGLFLIAHEAEQKPRGIALIDGNFKITG